ncbi:uncharacterized protein BDV14DRAFT_12961 [Aspergillus stella-maris]|uniref:uncharacterized protein n=1 Tax=Aspergillus stella-maris TaxID=1810926 RepID=UPI003CCD6A9A
MRVSILAIVFAAAGVVAQDEPTTTAASTTIVNVSQLPSQLSQLANLLPTLPANWELPSSVKSLKDSLPTPPSGIITDLVRGVPTSVLQGLVNPASRSALQQSVADGDIPTWYQDLPTPVKSYVALFATQIADRNITYKPSAAVASSGSTVQPSTADNAGADTGKDSTSESWDLGEADDDESAALSSFDKKAVSTSLVLALGILGLAISL